MFVLDRLWRGEVSPSERRIAPNSEYLKILHENTLMEDELCKDFTREQKDLYLKMETNQLEMMEIADKEAFFVGFRIGAGLILDVIFDHKEQLPGIREAG